MDITENSTRELSMIVMNDFGLYSEAMNADSIDALRYVVSEITYTQAQFDELAEDWEEARNENAF